MSDKLYRFVFDNADLRGEIVQLDELYAALTRRGEYPPVLASLLGEALAATALLTATLKFRGSLSLQLQGDGPLRLLLVQASNDGGIRAMARPVAEIEPGALEAQFRNGTLVITIDPDDDKQRYQGVVDISGGSLAASLEHYFSESEQLATRVWLSADGERAAGLLLQRLPAQQGAVTDADAWVRAGHLAGTLGNQELRATEPVTLLRRLFHEEDVRVFEPLALRLQCRCSRARVASVVASLGAAEVHDILAEQGRVEVRCDFCNAAYRFDAVDAEALFTEPGQRPPSSQREH